MTCATCNDSKVFKARRVVSPSFRRINVGIVPSTYEYIEEPCPDCTLAGKVIALGRKICERHLAGCCWHIVLDDYNFDDASIEFCAQYAVDNAARCESEGACLQLAAPMRQLSERERSIAWRGDDHEDYACGVCGFVTIYPEVLDQHVREQHPH